MNKVYMAIDLKSFFASVECVERGLDPLNTNLVVADETRTEKTICLAVTPSLKARGISGRARLFEVVQRVEEINRSRRAEIGGRAFSGSSYLNAEIQNNPGLELSYIVAKPRMSKYIEYSNRVFNVYLQYFASEDIHAYSIDEVFIDATSYLAARNCSPSELAMEIVLKILRTTGVTATAGIGPNLFLCKVAMDVQAKRIPADKNGVRIAELSEESFRNLLWDHTPVTDFWQLGPGTADKLARYGMHTLRDVAMCSIGKDDDFYNEKLLYKIFGVNAEVLIDHAWGLEPCTIADIKNYVPQTKSLSQGQVLKRPYSCREAATVLSEMAESIALELLSKGLVSETFTLVICYDNEEPNLKQKNISLVYDRYGRPMPKWDRGTAHLPFPSSLTSLISEALLSLYRSMAKPYLTIRRITVSAENTQEETEVSEENPPELNEQMSLFEDEGADFSIPDFSELKREKAQQMALLQIKERYGKNAILKGTNFKPEATAIERNGQIGGHKA